MYPATSPWQVPDGPHGPGCACPPGTPAPLNFGIIGDPYVTTAFVHAARTPQERMARWASIGAGLVATWHEKVTAIGLRATGTPHVRLMHTLEGADWLVTEGLVNLGVVGPVAPA